MQPTVFRDWKIHHGCQAAILKMILLKINRFQPINTSIVQLVFGVDIQSQTKARVGGDNMKKKEEMKEKLQQYEEIN